MHNHGATCASGTKCHGAGRARPCERPFGVACLALWFPRQCGGLNPATMLRMYGQARRRQAALRACRAVVVSSRYMVAQMVGNGFSPDRVSHLPLFPAGIVPDAVPPAARPFEGRVLLAGRLTALKGWRHLLDAWPAASAALGRPLSLVVAGDGPDRDVFEAECRRRHTQSQFLGWVTPMRLAEEMRRSDLLAVPSVWPEPFGLAGLEAGCVGLPAVAFAVGGIPEWLTPGISGESAPGDVPDAGRLAEALVRAASDPGHWQRLRVGAWETARRFTAEAHLDRLLKVLRRAGFPEDEGASGR
jgi:glycosyltransferase involved in cell wall biosynthesis